LIFRRFLRRGGALLWRGPVADAAARSERKCRCADQMRIVGVPPARKKIRAALFTQRIFI